MYEDEGGLVIIWRWVMILAIVMGPPLGAYLYWFAEMSSIRITVDNQATDPVLVCVYIDGEDLGHQRDSQWVNFSDIVDLDKSYSIKRGSHLVLVKTIVPELEYRCTVSVGLFETEPIPLRLTEASLGPA